MVDRRLVVTTPPVRELEPLRRASVVVLTALRLAGGALGLGVIAFAIWYGLHTDDGRDAGIAYAALGISFGVPLLMPLRWLRRHWLRLLPVFALPWFGPLPLDPQPWAFILRMFATGVAISALIVWHMLQSLTTTVPTSSPPAA